MTVAIYIRQTAGGPTAAQQRADCILALEARRWPLMREFVDIETPGGRPGAEYDQMLMAMRRQQVRHIVAYSVERMFRNVPCMMKILECARVGGASFLFCRENISTEGVNGDNLVRAMKLIADLVDAHRSEFFRVAMEDRRRRGLPVGRPRKRTPEIDNAIAAALDDGVPICAIARELRLPRNFVRVRARDRVTQVQE